MPSFKDFVKGAEQPDKYSSLEKTYGQFGCQKCDENQEYAYIDVNKGLLIWVCSYGHESKVAFQ